MGKRVRKKQKERSTTLILCQGTKAEPRYFKSLIALFHASGAKVQSDSLDPVKLTQKAQTLAKRNDFDQVFIVVDLDETSPTEMQRAISLCKKSSNKKHQFTLILSSICFEVWVIAHKKEPVAATLDPTALKKQALDLGLMVDEQCPIPAATFPYAKWQEAKGRVKCRPGNEYFPHPASAIPIVIEHLQKNSSRL